MPEDVHEATDVVDEGLSVIRYWEQRGPTPFRGIAADMFRFGTRLYIHFQPHFLNEFVSENLNPEDSSPEYVSSEEMQAVAREVAQYLS
jgi:hypothetical protein